MPGISVIIPAYNVANYLPKALDSVLSQTYADFELIVVDDGSTDGTGKVCDQYAELDARVKVIHQKNAGAPAARNAAIEIATGEYLYFMDGDDWAEPDMLAAMRDLAEATGTDLVITGYYIDTYHNRKRAATEKKSLPCALYRDAASFRRAATGLFDKNLLYTPWNKLFRAARVRALNIRFRQTKWDDFPFNVDYILDIETVAVDARAFYHFTRGLYATETSRYFPGIRKKRDEEHADMLALYGYWGLMGDPEAEEFLARRYVERMFGVLENIVCKDSPLNRAEKRACVRDVLTSEYAAWSLARAVPRSVHVRLMYWAIGTGNAGMVYALSTFISFVKNRFSKAFTFLKAHR